MDTTTMTTEATASARLEFLAICTLNRMDTKGETLAEAAEAVTGGNREDMAEIARQLGGQL